MPGDVHEVPLFPAPAEQSVATAQLSFSPARKSRIESRMALRGNHTLGGSQASENIASARGDRLAMLHCISITATHNIVGVCNTSWGKFFLVLLQALEHIVCLHWHADAVFLKFFAATSCPAFFRLSNIKLGGRNKDGNREKPRDRRDGAKADGLLHDFILPNAMISQSVERCCLGYFGPTNSKIV